MAYSTPNSLTTGDLVAASEWNKNTVDNVVALKAMIDDVAVTLTNGSGATRSAGDVVIYSTGADNEFTTTTTIGDKKVIGVVVDTTIANGASGAIATTGGVVDILCTTAAVSRGDHLQTSATAGQAQAGKGGAFAIALEAKSAGSAGLVSSVLIEPLAQVCALYRGALSVAHGSWTTVSWTTEKVNNAEMFDAGSNTKITIQVPGTYRVSATVSGAAAPGEIVNAQYFRLCKNGATHYTVYDVPNASSIKPSAITLIDDFSASDYLEIQLYQTNNLSQSESFGEMWFSVERVV